MEFERFYRYDFAITRLMTEMASKYYGIVISGHMVAYSPKSVVQILNETKKPFFIDPVSYVFARDVDNICRDGKVRKSYHKLIEEYGDPFTKCLSSGQVSPSDFYTDSSVINETLLEEVISRVFTFQLTKCQAQVGNFAKYERLLQKGITPTEVTPLFLIPPYFYSQQYGDEWYAISLRFAQKAKELYPENAVYPVICISSDILWNTTEIDAIIADYSDFDGFVIWVDNFDEKYVQVSELNGISRLIMGLKNESKPVYSLYGGYLCDLLSKFGLSGYASGICYGEKRSIDTRGGGAGNRYYVPSAHLKISEDLSNAFFAESNRNMLLMCRCRSCSEIHDSIPNHLPPREYVDRFYSQMDFFAFRRHFINTKYQEMLEIDAMTNSEIYAKLSSNIIDLSNIDHFARKPRELGSGHLRAWQSLFS